VISIVQAAPTVRRIRFRVRSRRGLIGRRLLTDFLFLAQPAVRLSGRLSLGLAPWRRRAPISLSVPRTRSFAIWCEDWIAPEERLAQLERALIASGQAVGHGGAFDRWDLEIRVGLLGGARVRMAVEDHGAGTQFVRFEVGPRWARASAAVALALGGVAAAAAGTGAWWAFGLLAAGAGAIAIGVVVVPASAVALAVRLARGLTADEFPQWGGRLPAFARSGDLRVPH
jgi:hypothetical protein